MCFCAQILAVGFEDFTCEQCEQKGSIAVTQVGVNGTPHSTPTLTLTLISFITHTSYIPPSSSRLSLAHYLTFMSYNVHTINSRTHFHFHLQHRYHFLYPTTNSYTLLYIHFQHHSNFFLLST